MNSLVFDIRRFTIHDGPGIRTTVFFKGCPLRCQWCHNPESQEVATEKVTIRRVLDGRNYHCEETIGRWYSEKEVMHEIEKDMVFYRESGGGVTFSGGEPLMQADALAQLLHLSKERELHTVVDTSGHAEPAAIQKVMPLTDLWLYDLKLMDDLKHVEYTGVSNDLALKNLEMLSSRGNKVIIRFPLVPGITDGIENLEGIAFLMRKNRLNRIDILPYHSIAREKYRRLGQAYLHENLMEPDKIRIDEVRSFFSGSGFETGPDES